LELIASVRNQESAAMNDRTESRSPLRWAVLLALLLPAQGTTCPAAAPAVAPAPAAASLSGVAPRPAVFADIKTLFSNRDTMIQVGVVVGAIAIFILTRGTK
jgi:hypothetical protein